MANPEAAADTAPSAPMRSSGGGVGSPGPSGGGGRAAPTTRRIGRNKSSGAPRGLSSGGGGLGGMGGAGGPRSRMAPKRSQSHRIGRPAFAAESGAAAATGGVAGMATTGGQPRVKTRAAPVATGSFRRAVPNRSSSSNSLRAFRKNKQVGNTPFAQQQPVEYDGDTTDCDSVFTSASTQTMDSIMLRKKQKDGGGGGAATGAGAAARGVGSGVGDGGYVDFDESIHTVDSIKVHMRHVVHQQPLEGGDIGDDSQGDMSVFSESSFDDTDTYLLSDYEELDENDEGSAGHAQGAAGVDRGGGIPEEVATTSDDEGPAGGIIDEDDILDDEDVNNATANLNISGGGDGEEEPLGEDAKEQKEIVDVE